MALLLVRYHCRKNNFWNHFRMLSHLLVFLSFCVQLVLGDANPTRLVVIYSLNIYSLTVLTGNSTYIYIIYSCSACSGQTKSHPGHYLLLKLAFL